MEKILDQGSILGATLGWECEPVNYAGVGNNRDHGGHLMWAATESLR